MKRETKNALLCLFFFLICVLVHFCGTFKIPWDDPYSPGYTLLLCFPPWLAGLLAGGLPMGFGAVRRKLLSSPFFPCLLLSASAMFLLTWGNFRESISETMEWLGLRRFFDYSYLLPHGEQGNCLPPVHGHVVPIGMTWLILLDLPWAFPSLMIGYILPWRSHLYLTVHGMIHNTAASWSREAYALLCGVALAVTLRTISARRKAPAFPEERSRAGCQTVRMTFLRGIMLPFVLVPAIFIAGSASNLWVSSAGCRHFFASRCCLCYRFTRLSR